MKINNRIIIGLAIILLLIASSYLFENIIQETGMKSATVIKITDNNKTIAFISVDVLKQLVEENNKKDDEGMPSEPSLLLAMNAAGVNKFKQIEIKGNGVEGSVILNEEDINNSLKLFLKDNGTVDLCRENDKSNTIVKSVTEINIRDGN
ncbi:MAG: hypothetical protein Q8936_17020 [Bacillota bacterium]|nr:hypothetical protein [Bacillota bacterium]